MDTATASVCQGLIDELSKRLHSDEFKARHRQSQTDFTRKRCLPFVIVVVFLLNMLKHSLQDELDEFFNIEKNSVVAAREVTKSAFSQARKKLKPDAFIELNRVQVDYFYAHFESETWHGHRLIAVDGSTCVLPRTPEVREHFGALEPAQGDACPLARVSQMFDVLNKITLDARIAPHATGERELAAQHFAHLKAGDLVLLDRGYPAFWLFAMIGARQAHFCARMPLGIWNVVDQFVASGRDEQIVTLQPSRKAVEECQARGLSTEPLTMRLIRVELDTGEIEVLATSLLDSETYPVTIFKALYHQRWPVEEDYQFLKCRIEVENFSGKTVLAIYQDFHAKVFTKNLTAILAHPAQKVVRQESQGKQYTYQVNMTNAFSKMKDTVVVLLRGTHILSILKALWQQMVTTIEPIRPGRSYPRQKRVKPRRFPMTYKPIR